MPIGAAHDQADVFVLDQPKQGVCRRDVGRSLSFHDDFDSMSVQISGDILAGLRRQVRSAFDNLDDHDVFGSLQERQCVRDRTARTSPTTSLASAWILQSGILCSASNLLEAISAACVELSTSGTSIFPCRHLNECPSELSRTL